MDSDEDDPDHQRHRLLRGGTTGASLGLPTPLHSRHMQDVSLHRQLLRRGRSADRARRPGPVPRGLPTHNRAVPTPSRRRHRNQQGLLNNHPVVVTKQTDPPRARAPAPSGRLRGRPRRNLQLRGCTHRSDRKPSRRRPLAKPTLPSMTKPCQFSTKPTCVCHCMKTSFEPSAGCSRSDSVFCRAFHGPPSTITVTTGRS